MNANRVWQVWAVEIRDARGNWKMALNGKGGPAIYYWRKDAWCFARELRKHVGGRIRTKPARIEVIG